MTKEYSFYDSDDNYSEDEVMKKNHRRNFHVPQSRQNARSGTVGSFSSITSKYNNIYKNDNL